jgi:hypothetical protein
VLALAGRERHREALDPTDEVGPQHLRRTGLGDVGHAEYIDAVEVGPADFVAPVAVGDFRAAWESLGPAGEVLETFQLPIKSVADAVTSVVGMLGMVRAAEQGGGGG